MLLPADPTKQILNTIKSEVNMRREKSKQREKQLHQIVSDVNNENEQVNSNDISQSVAEKLNQSETRLDGANFDITDETNLLDSLRYPA